MSDSVPVIVIGAGIVGVSTAIWLQRAGRDVLLLDRDGPGQGTSFGNAGVLANCSVVPVTTPGLIKNGPNYLFNPNFPLFLRWSYLPRLMPWLLRYLRHANDTDTRRIADGLAEIVGDSVEEHAALLQGTSAASWMVRSDYTFAYANRAAFDKDAYVWQLRAEAGFAPQILEADEAREYEPNLGPDISCLAVMKDHGFISDPGGYVVALADEFQKLGGAIRKAEVVDFDFTDGKISGVVTRDGTLACSEAVITTGVWSKPLMKKLGISVPLESERGYHIVYENAENGPRMPIMVAGGKFVATPMKAGLRCAGIVEFGGLDAGPSNQPLALLRKTVKNAFPNLRASNEIEWHGHRPAPSDSLPLIGQVNGTGIYAGFGHHHIGLSSGPKTGRLIAQLIAGQRTNIDLAPYDPHRFAR